MEVVYKNDKFIDFIDVGIERIKLNLRDEKDNFYEINFSIEEIYYNKNKIFETPLFNDKPKLILQVILEGNELLYLILFNNNIIIKREKISIEKTKLDYDIFSIYSLVNNFEEVKILRTGLGTFRILVTENEQIIFEKDIKRLLSNEKINIWIDYELNIKTSQNMITLSSILCDNVYFFITYFPKRKQVNFSKIKIESSSETINNLKAIDKNIIELEIGDQRFKFDFRNSKKEEIVLQKNTKIKLEKPIEKLRINNQYFYVYIKNGSFMISGNYIKAFGIRTKLKSKITNKNLYIYGLYQNTSKLVEEELDYLFIKNHDIPTTKFKRPFPFLKKFGIWKLPVCHLLEIEDIHRSLQMGSKNDISFPLFMNTNKDVEKFHVFTQKKVADEVIMLRGNVGGGTSLTKLPFSQEYTIKNRIRIKLAYFLNKIIPQKKAVNLYFEKKSKKADESAIHVFREVIKRNSKKSKNYFIMEKNAENYEELKKEFGEAIITKYTFKHFWNIFRSTCFISTELSNHVINDRIFLNKIRSKITETPLIFLQHGIMFAKPIDNPMAKGFHKKNLGINLKKVVINSELEAQEFYKVGYEKEDLLLSGLATFDFAKLDKDANKIAYMPTYRYWEEHLVYTGRMTETSYYQDLISILNAFKKNDLLDKLLLVPHNKFAAYILDAFPEYVNNIEVNPSIALKKANIFITDYSSAIYDATIRGAYPIFYWKEKKYLIENYKAIPPVNEENAPGDIAYSEDELVNIIKDAYAKGLHLSEEIIEKYRAINKFHDGKNTQRIVRYLEKENLI